MATSVQTLDCEETKANLIRDICRAVNSSHGDSYAQIGDEGLGVLADRMYISVSEDKAHFALKMEGEYVANGSDAVWHVSDITQVNVRRCAYGYELTTTDAMPRLTVFVSLLKTRFGC